MSCTMDGKIAEKLKYGMVGGGRGAFIGDVHRKAAAFDGMISLAAACFSRDRQTSLETGRHCGLSEDRIYENYQAMAEKESAREDGIDFVSIVTPNSSHYPIAKAFLEKGIHVMCDKPLALSVSEAEELARLAEERQLLFGVTYVNAGYPLIRKARTLVQSGEIGDIRMVMAEYPQEGLAVAKRKGKAWRSDPRIAGPSLSVGDIGVHIENTVAYITGLRIRALCAQLDYFGESELDTNASVLIKYVNGASGMYWCSKIAIGHTNDLSIRIFGTKGTLEWRQIHPNELKLTKAEQPTQLIVSGRDLEGDDSTRFHRLPAGHPEGTYEAFANLYNDFSKALLSRKSGADKLTFTDFPTVHDGVAGVKFIEKCMESAKSGGKWVDFAPDTFNH